MQSAAPRPIGIPDIAIITAAAAFVIVPLVWVGALGEAPRAGRRRCMHCSLPSPSQSSSQSVLADHRAKPRRLPSFPKHVLIKSRAPNFTYRIPFLGCEWATIDLARLVIIQVFRSFLVFSLSQTARLTTSRCQCPVTDLSTITGANWFLRHHTDVPTTMTAVISAIANIELVR